MPSSACQTSARSEEHTSELQSHSHLVCRLLLEKKERRGSEEHTSELQSHSHLVCRLMVETRQPLARALVSASGFAELSDELRREVAEELNVGVVEPFVCKIGDPPVNPIFPALGALPI